MNAAPEHDQANGASGEHRTFVYPPPFPCCQTWPKKIALIDLAAQAMEGECYATVPRIEALIVGAACWGLLPCNTDNWIIRCGGLQDA